MKIADYFSGIERSLRRIEGAELSGQIISLASDDYNGLLRCRVLFWDESFLDIYEVVNTELGYPIKVHYSLMLRTVPMVQAESKPESREPSGRSA